MKRLVVWYNSRNNSYYYKIVRGFFYESYDYVVGAVNSYGHTIVLIIELNDVFFSSIKPFYPMYSMKDKIIKKLISFLKKL